MLIYIFRITLVYYFSVTLGAKTYVNNFTTRDVTIVHILIKNLLIKLQRPDYSPKSSKETDGDNLI